MSQSPNCVHEATASCGAVPGRFNVFEQRELMQHPRGDVMNQVRRGMITPAWQLGLRLSQRRPFSLDAFNSGCVDAHACAADAKDSGGYTCAGGQSRPSAEFEAAYRFLNTPLASDDFEYKPPDYMLKGNVLGPDSVAGWAGSKRIAGPLWRENAPAEDCRV